MRKGICVFLAIVFLSLALAGCQGAAPEEYSDLDSLLSAIKEQGKRDSLAIPDGEALSSLANVTLRGVRLEGETLVCSYSTPEGDLVFSIGQKGDAAALPDDKKTDWQDIEGQENCQAVLEGERVSLRWLQEGRLLRLDMPATYYGNLLSARESLLTQVSLTEEAAGE